MDQLWRAGHGPPAPGTKVPSSQVAGPFLVTVVRAQNNQVIGPDSSRDKHRWATPTGDPCPRSQHMDGRVEGGGDCHGCGFCLLLAGLVELVPPACAL